MAQSHVAASVSPAEPDTTAGPRVHALQNNPPRQLEGMFRDTEKKKGRRKKDGKEEGDSGAII